MKSLLFALLLLLPLPALATNWYVRADGGTRYSATNRSGQCSGTSDAAYPGSGVNKPCALSDPRYLYSDGGNKAYSWAISGGDTVLLRGGPWRIGQNNATNCGPFSNQCYADVSMIPPPPAGTGGQPTTFRGENFANCSAKTQLYGGYTVNGIFNLRGSSHVLLQCLEMTDHSQCTVMGIRKPISCNSSIIDDFAKSGILTDQNTRDIVLQDLDIHGFRDNGIVGPVGGVVTATRVRIAFNGGSGWNFDDGNATKSVNGQMNWSYVTIEGNGCVEEYPIQHSFPAAYCYDDGNGGYGDGVGTPDTQISFSVDHSVIRYNTQDGLDLLHTSGSNITVTTSSFYGNMGQQLKLGPMASTTASNNLFLTNCKRMSADIAGAPTGWNAGLSDFCRAQAGVVMVQRGDKGGGGTYTWVNNDFLGYAGDAMFESGVCTDTYVYAPTTDCTTPNIVFQNNLMVGYPYVVQTYHYGELPPPGTDGDSRPRFKTVDHNIYYSMRSCPSETGSSCANPFLKSEPPFQAGVPDAETVFDTVNFALTAASANAIGKGVVVPGLLTDFLGVSRGSSPTIGALMYVGPSVPTSPVSSVPPSVPPAETGLASVRAAATTNTTVSLRVAQPRYGFHVLPGATRRLVASVSDGETNGVTWSMSAGAAQLSARTGPWVDVTAPPSGSSCQYVARGSGYGVSSATSFTVRATSVDDPTQTTDVRFDVCNPGTEVAVVPAYRTLYSGQAANLQSFVLGNVNNDVEWTLTAQPKGGDGQLADGTLRDAVFSATVAGRYTLTATSVAAPGQSATATLYVTGHAMPYRVTPLGTEPVDCTADPALVGQVYEVGPSQAYARLADLPLDRMTAGSTVRVHNEDTSGGSPTTYHEFVQISTHATADQPLRVCGVPDSLGHLPILDGSGATGSSGSPAGVVTVHNTGETTAWPNSNGPTNIQIEGLQIRSANSGTTYSAADGSSGGWSTTSACVAVREGQNVSIVGNDLGNCSQGGRSGWNAGLGWSGSDLNALWEGNHLHGNGVAGSDAGHQLSLESWNTVVQFNRVDEYAAGALGANIRSRGIGDVIRYNILGDGPARQIDLLGVSDASPYMSYAAFLASNDGAGGVGAAEVYPADRIAAEQEAWNAHFVYGNSYQDSTSAAAIHFAEDADGGETAREGSLFWYHNTYNRAQCAQCGSAAWPVLDTSAEDGSIMPLVEYGDVRAFDNIVWTDVASRSQFVWNNRPDSIGTVGVNLVPTGINGLAGEAGAGQGVAVTVEQDVAGFSSANLLTTGTQPFDPASFLLSVVQPSLSALPRAVCAMPTRFAYLPGLNFAVPRVPGPNLGAADSAQQTLGMMSSVAGGSRVGETSCF